MLKVTYDPNVCAHAANCVNTLPDVFKVENGKLVIDTTAATEERIRKTVAGCPSGALRVHDP